mgnify:CR=1 FL=1
MTQSELIQYREGNPDCEIWRYFRDRTYPRSFGGVWVSEHRRCPGASQLHHICGSGNGARRANEITNIIHVSPEAHEWLDTEKLAGFVLCCFHKRTKGELDWERLNAIKGKYVKGWLDTDEMIRACAISEGLQRMRLKLLEGE